MSGFEKTEKKTWSSFFFWYCVFFLIAILFRLPHFLSKAFWFDGDEGLVGIMAQDILAGKNFSLYFIGQNYGLTIFESLSTAFWIKILGIGIWPLRLGGLTVFCFGVYFIFKGLIHRDVSLKMAFLFALGLLCFPTWYLWGAMVRGGYVTAFAAAGILFYLLALKEKSWRNLLLIGIVTTILFESHNLLLFAISPLILRDWLNKKYTFPQTFVVIAIGIILYFSMHATVIVGEFMHRPMLDYTSFSEFPSRWMQYLDGFLNSFGGFYYLGFLFEIPLWWKNLLILALILLVVLIIKLFMVLNKRDRILIVIWLFSTCAIFLMCAFPVGYSPRYLISFFTGILFLFAFFVTSWKSNFWTNRILLFVLCIFLGGIGVGSKMKRDWYDTRVNCVQTMEKMHSIALKNHLKGVYISDYLLQWQWNYLYGKEIPGTCFIHQDKDNRFLVAVDSIYHKSPTKIGIIGYWGLFLRNDYIAGFNDTRQSVNDKYYIQPVMKEEYHIEGYKAMSKPYVPLKFND